jgi:endonuclease YncB( thermonuclease family)
MDTPEGRRAKRFVEFELKDVPYIIITSSKSDKYDRYLADIHYNVKAEERFLNNVLLERGFAVRMED